MAMVFVHGHPCCGVCLIMEGKNERTLQRRAWCMLRCPTWPKLLCCPPLQCVPVLPCVQKLLIIKYCSAHWRTIETLIWNTQAFVICNCWLEVVVLSDTTGLRSISFARQATFKDISWNNLWNSQNLLCIRPWVVFFFYYWCCDFTHLLLHDVTFWSVSPAAFKSISH